MSRQNKHAVKADRRYSREFKATTKAERIPVSEMPSHVNLALMCEAGSGDRSTHRALLAARGQVVNLPKTGRSEPAIKRTLRLAAFSLNRVLRERRRTARRAATYMYAARKTTLGSTLRDAYENAQSTQLYYLNQINAELKARTTLALSNEQQS
jgi:hypothetical protein